jgi:hypothetical protein
VNGCGRRLQPLVKVDSRDRSTWLYPECESGGKYVCEAHSSTTGGRLICDRCRPRIEAEEVPLIDLNIRFGMSQSKSAAGKR